jgi:hypothetical protein
MTEAFVFSPFHTYLTLCISSLNKSCSRLMQQYTTEHDSGQRFSKQEHIQAYVPQVRHRLFAYPLLACDITSLEPRHIGWTDSLHNHEYYNLHNDLEFLHQQAQREGEQTSRQGPVLSVIGHWKEIRGN